MAKLKLDLSKVKHVHSDEHSTLLKHQDGHEIRLAHSALSPENQAQLAALSKIPQQAAQSVDKNMAKGGQIPRKKSYDDDYNKDGSKDKNSIDYAKIRQDKRNINNHEESQPIIPGKPRLADGGEVNNPKLAESHKTPKFCSYCGKGIHDGECDGGEVKMAEGGDPVNQIVPNYQDPMQVENQPEAKALPEPQPTDKDAQLEAYKHNLPDIKRGMKFATPDNSQEAHMPGPNGEPPIAGYDVNAWQNAQADVANAKEDNAAKIAAAQQQAIQQNQIRAQLGQQPLPVPNVPNGPQVPGSMENPPNPQNLPPGAQVNPLDPSGNDEITNAKTVKPDLTQDPFAMAQQGYKNQLAGIQNTGAAQAEQADRNAEILKQAQDTKAKALATYQSQFKELDDERKAHIEDINNNLIDPNRYWTGDKNGDGSHSKIAAGIGMILAGFNPTNRPNAAIEFLKYQMDKNIQAQVSNLGAKETMLQANLHQFGNIRDAMTMTNLMQTDMIANQLQQSAAKAANPLAKAAALNAAGQLQAETAPKMQQFAMQRAMMNMANNPAGSDDASVQHMIGYLRMFNPQAGENMAKRFVPGVGLSPTQEVPQDVRQKLIAHQNLTKFATNLKTFIQAHGGALDRMSPDLRAEAAAMALPVQAAFREGALGTVYREGEQPLLDKAVKAQPLDFASYFINTEPKKLDVMLKTNEDQSNILKKAYDLPIRPSQSQPQYKTVNGVKYMRGPNGEAVPVK